MGARRYGRAWGVGVAVGGAFLACACSLVESIDGLTGGAPDAEADANQVLADAAGDASFDVNDGAPRDAASDLPPPPRTGYERPITIANRGSSTLPAGYAVSIALDTSALVAAGKLRSDENDLRVVDPASAQRDRIVDNGSPSTIWFTTSSSIPANGSAVYWVRYGAPDAGAAPSDPHRVFVFHDDFANGRLDPQWHVNGSPVLGNGTVTLRRAQQDALTTNAAIDTVPIASSLEIVAKVTDPASAPQATSSGTFYYWLGYQHTGDFVASEPWIVWIARGVNVIGPEQQITGSPSCTTGCMPAMPIAQDTSYHSYVIARPSAGTRFYRDGALRFSVGDPSTVDYSIMIRNWAMTSDLVVRLVRARPLVEPEPTVTLGAEVAGP